MSREIKYRAWLKNQKQMFDVVAIDFYENTISYIIDDYANVTQIWETSEFEEVELIQYAGISDPNGNEVYESDIIEDKHGRKNIVKFTEGLFLIGNWNAHGFMNAFTEFKVIGNIYENPELLEDNNE